MLDKFLRVADKSDVLTNYSDLLCQPSYKNVQQ